MYSEPLPVAERERVRTILSEILSTTRLMENHNRLRDDDARLLSSIITRTLTAISVVDTVTKLGV